MIGSDLGAPTWGAPTWEAGWRAGAASAPPTHKGHWKITPYTYRQMPEQ